MLELLSVQRHDFLNHLQIISGLLQLNRETEAREYIRTVSRDIVSLSKVVHLQVPEVAAVLLMAYNRAVSYQIEMAFDVQANLKDCTVPGEELASLLEELLNNIIDYLAPPEVAARKISIGIMGTEVSYSWQISFSAAPYAYPTRVEESAQRAVDNGVRLKLYITN
ncbi:Spo0B domain-containing protein [Desulfoscipio gibsoniae]|uniref:SpoOB alpha-helical domain-containing protein n=1 Tax=Desulfoscipio gibsoniae DSM 7213 TaxID=767817 RepID=R4KPY9_9FIRM|nr:Spo0B domain-containing protein [Desulfoscipio gibsoniae]AGL02635.1 hypothetical protein Desgi_3289 [Desulfoscipio gibsoniae DSM 7213]